MMALSTICAVVAALASCYVATAQLDEPLPVRSFLPQLQQLALVTEDGQYCTTVPVAAPGTALRAGPATTWAIACNSSEMPNVISFNLDTVMSQFQYLPLTTISTQFSLTVRPAAAPPTVIFSDGLIMSVGGRPARGGLGFIGAGYAFESLSEPGVPDLAVPFGANGTTLMYLTVPAAMPGATTVYCRVGEYAIQLPGFEPTNDTLSSMLVCDLDTPDNATMFRIQPYGWSWTYARVSFQSVLSGQMCGNSVDAISNGFVTCTNGTGVNETDWSADMFSNVMSELQLPMRNDAHFMMQAWSSYSVPAALWATDSSTFIRAFEFDTVTGEAQVPTGSKPYLLMMKSDVSSNSTTISSGDTVLIRSVVSGLYCGVHAGNFRIQCKWSADQVSKAANRKVFQFLYLESMAS